MGDDREPGWLPDPTGRHDHRYWDGAAWTEHVADAGVAGNDPYDPAPEPTAGAAAPWATTTADPAPTAEPDRGPEPEPTPEPQPPEPEPEASGTLTWNPAARPADLPGPRPTQPQPSPAAPAGSTPPSSPAASPFATPTSPATPPAAQPAGPSPTGWASAPASPYPTTPPVASSLPTPEEVEDALARPAEPEAPPTPVVPPTGPAPTPAAPTAPVPTPGSSGDDGSGRKRLLLGVGALLVVAVVVGLVLVLGGGTSERDRVTDDLAAWIRTQDNTNSDEDVECLADAIVDKLGTRVLADADFSSPVPLSGANGARFITAYASGVQSCEIASSQLSLPDPGQAGGDGSPGTTEVLSEDEQAEQYQEQYDLAEEQARCLAKADIDVRRRAEAGEQLTTEQLLAYIDACQVPREALGLGDVENTTTTAPPAQP